MRRLAESVCLGAIGGLLAGAVGRLLGLERAFALIGAGNGLISGWRGVYRLDRARGWAAFTLDSTWGLLGTGAGLALHGVNRLLDGGYHPGMSQDRDRHVYAAGFAPRRGFAVTMGNVVSNGGGPVGLDGDDPRVVRRRRLIDLHEELHIWQNRWFGPAFPAVYGAWLVAGAVAATVAWPWVRGSWWEAVETVAYYDNPFEYWAYRRDGYWPPKDTHPKLVWGPRTG